MGVIAGVVVIYTSMEKNSIDCPLGCSTIIALFKLSFRK